MFLKPETTKDFAARIGHRFHLDYEPGLVIEVYESLLDLVKITAAELADFGSRDRIDVQSFIWVVGNYTEGHEQPDTHLDGESLMAEKPKKPDWDPTPPFPLPDGELNVIGYLGDDPKVAAEVEKQIADRKKKGRDRLGL